MAAYPLHTTQIHHITHPPLFHPPPSPPPYNRPSTPCTSPKSLFHFSTPFQTPYSTAPHPSRSPIPLLHTSPDSYPTPSHLSSIPIPLQAPIPLLNTSPASLSHSSTPLHAASLSHSSTPLQNPYPTPPHLSRFLSHSRFSHPSITSSHLSQPFYTPLLHIPHIPLPPCPHFSMPLHSSSNPRRSPLPSSTPLQYSPPVLPLPHSPPVLPPQPSSKCSTPLLPVAIHPSPFHLFLLRRKSFPSPNHTDPACTFIPPTPPPTPPPPLPPPPFRN